MPIGVPQGPLRLPLRLRDVMNNEPDIEQKIAELKAAGWMPLNSWTWKAPHGALYLGPAGAWRYMKAIQDNPICPRVVTS